MLEGEGKTHPSHRPLHLPHPKPRHPHPVHSPRHSRLLHPQDFHVRWATVGGGQNQTIARVLVLADLHMEGVLMMQDNQEMEYVMALMKN